MRVEAYVGCGAENVVRVAARTIDTGRTFLLVVDEDGEPVNGGKLLELRPEGIVRTEDVDPSLGFPLDARGCLKIL